MATIAVFIALGGTSFAAIRITGRDVPKDALTGADIKNLTGKDIKNDSVTGADVKGMRSADVTDGSLLAEDFKAGQLPVGKQGSKGDPGISATKLFGNIDGTTGALVKGSGITSAQRSSTGLYIIQFNQNIDNCVLLAGPGSQDSSNPESRTVGVSHYSAQANSAFVLIGSDFASTRADADFSIAAFC